VIALVSYCDGDLLQDAFAYDSEEEAIADAETIIGDTEYRIEQHMNVGRLQYTDGRRSAKVMDALAMARAEGLDV
jgi:protein-disulfide isomerase-like protein with CxxC motif